MTVFGSCTKLTSHPPLSDEKTRELIERTHSGDTMARDELMQANFRLVMSLAQKFARFEGETDDFFQVGSIGLMKAINKFDLSYDVKLSTYAVPFIIGEIKRYVRDGGVIKVSRRYKQIAYKTNSARNDYLIKNGHEPTISELADLTGFDRSEIVEALEACREPAYIDEPLSGEDDDHTTLSDCIASDDGHGIISIDKLADRLALSQSMKHLDERSRKIIILRFFREKTQQQTAAILGISQVHVSRLEKQILERLRSQLT